MIHRTIVFSYDEDLYLEFAPRFKIRKCPSEYPQPQMQHAHHPYFFDYEVEEAQEELGVGSYGYDLSEKPKFEKFEKKPIRKFIAQIDANNKIFNEILQLINATTDSHIFVYDNRQAWTLGFEDQPKESRYSTEIYTAPDYEPPSEITPLVNYDGKFVFHLSSADGRQQQFVRLGDLFSQYFNCPDDKLRHKYLDACLVVDKAKMLAQYDISASYMFLVSAIETLVEIEHAGTNPDKCKCCGQPQHRVISKFRNFINKYGWNVEKKKIDEFYQLRSKITHVGKLFQSAYQHNFHPKDQEDMDKRHQQSLEGEKYRDFRRLVETCFATFLYANIK